VTDRLATVPKRAQGAPIDWRSYVDLTKPKVLALITFTSVVGTLLASARVPSLTTLAWASVGVALAAASAATLNHVLERQIDERMARTRARPLPAGRLSSRRACVLAAVLGALAMGILVERVNVLTAVLTFVSLIAYAGIYTLWLKHTTPQNIVIGGVAGAMPPVLGWTAITGRVEANALLLFLIIFVWTPPHFWSLAIARRAEYARAGIPMLPVTHGIAHTRLQILLYTILLTVVTLLPFLTGMSGPLYLGVTLILDAGFLYHAFALRVRSRPHPPMRVFRFSVTYLMWLFAALLIDHYLQILRTG
jgi:protoheme IX farnesyltransferase